MARPCMLALFMAFCGVGVCAADERHSAPASTTSQAQQAVDRSVGYIQAESAAWLSQKKCAACHHAPLVLWALSVAEKGGYAIDKKFLTDTTDSLLGSREKLLASKIFPNPADPPDPRPQGRGLNMGLPFLAVATQSLPLTDGQRQSVWLIAEEIVKKQQADGSWEYFDTLRRPPINESQITDAVWIILALRGGGDLPDPQRAAIEKALDWLKSAKPAGLFQEKVLMLLLAARSGRSRSELQPQIDEVYAAQRADGGWAQLAEMPSDAYATGQTLYVLAVIGDSAERTEIKLAIDFLVATQASDGSWPMTSRSTPDGRPGSAKLLTPITCAASSWATLGLARLVPHN